MVKECVLYLRLKKLVRKWLLLRIFLVPHATRRIHDFLFVHLSYDVVSFRGVTKPTLLAILIVVVDDDRNTLSK